MRIAIKKSDKDSQSGKQSRTTHQNNKFVKLTREADKVHKMGAPSVLDKLVGKAAGQQSTRASFLYYVVWKATLGRENHVDNRTTNIQQAAPNTILGKQSWGTAANPRKCPLLRNSASGPETGLPGRISAGF